MDINARINRRTFVFGAAAAAALLTRVTPAAAKQSKEGVNYQDQPNGDEQCGKCQHYEGNGVCRLVEGNVSPDGWWEMFLSKS